MTKVEINGRTYCVETLIYAVERLTKDVKSSAEYHNLVLDEIREEIAGLDTIMLNDNSKKVSTYIKLSDVREVIDKHSTEIEKKEADADNHWCNTCEYKHLESECLGCAEYDECDNLIDLRNYKKEE